MKRIERKYEENEYKRKKERESENKERLSNYVLINFF